MIEVQYRRAPEIGIKWHPLADLFPWIEGAAFDELVADVAKNGVIEPITMLDGQVLDGRNRYMAARQIGIEYPFVEFVGTDPLAFVIAKNLARRHLSESQRAMVAAKLAKMPQGARTDLASIDAMSDKQAAATLNVGEASVERAKVVHRDGAPELVAAVEQGDVAVSAAANIAKLPHDEQRRLIEAADPKVLRAVVKEMRADAQAGKKERRDERERQLASNIIALPTKKYGVIYADPEWRFEVFSEDTGQDRAAANHYPTSPTDAIAARPVASIAADDCALFLWATAPMLPDALRVMAAWDFAYKSHVVWDKGQAGTGYWFRNCHELLLIGTRGAIPAPAMGTQLMSVQKAAPGAHSEKPEWAALMIEQYFPNLPKIELNRRGAPRPGWDAWGNEVENAAWRR